MPKITFQLPIRHPKTLLDLHFECRNVSITADCGTLEGGRREEACVLKPNNAGGEHRGYQI